MNKLLKVALAGVVALTLSCPAWARVHGDNRSNAISGDTELFTLAARGGHISLPIGLSVWVWGYVGFNDTARDTQYPGVTMIVDQGDTVVVQLFNELGPDAPTTSIVFPGQIGVTASGGVAGVLTREATAASSVQYSFVASRPGTFHYHSGTDTDLQMEMGLSGTIIVRPNDGPGGPGIDYDDADESTYTAYGHPDTAYRWESLHFHTEMDLIIHTFVERGQMASVDMNAWFPTVWLNNGRCAPDTMEEAYTPWLPNQPYNCRNMTRVDELFLVRMVGGGRDTHPSHHHGAHMRVVGRDGRMLSTDSANPAAAAVGPNLYSTQNTLKCYPGHTIEAIWDWTGDPADLGWDYTGSDGTLQEQIGVVLPELKDMAFGGFYSGSPFLGAEGALPVGEGGLNPFAAFTFMWHSHTEREIVTHDVFPGGMMSMMLVLPDTAEVEMMLDAMNGPPAP